MTMFVSFDLALNDFSHLLGYLKSKKVMRTKQLLHKGEKLTVFSIIQGGPGLNAITRKYIILIMN